MYLLIFKLIYPIRLLNYCFNTLWYPSVHFCKLVLYKILREKNGRIREKSILPATQALNEKSARANLNHFLQTSYDPIVVFTQFHSKALFPDEALAVNTSFWIHLLILPVNMNVHLKYFILTHLSFWIYLQSLQKTSLFFDKFFIEI